MRLDRVSCPQVAVRVRASAAPAPPGLVRLCERDGRGADAARGPVPGAAGGASLLLRQHRGRSLLRHGERLQQRGVQPQVLLQDLRTRVSARACGAGVERVERCFLRCCQMLWQIFAVVMRRQLPNLDGVVWYVVLWKPSENVVQTWSRWCCHLVSFSALPDVTDLQLRRRMSHL